MGRVKNPTQIHSLRGPKFNCLRDGELRERKCTSNKTATQSASNNFRFARKEASGEATDAVQALYETQNIGADAT
jgi:hypothetical protein